MKVAMIGQKGIPASFGGIERHVDEMSRRLGALGHDVTVYTRSWYAQPPAGEIYPGVRAVVTPTIRTKHLDAIVHTFTSTTHAIRSGADVIHYHGVGPSLLAWIPRVFAPRAKVVATFHCIDRRQQKWGRLAQWALGLGERAACLFPHETIVVSKTLERYSLEHFGRVARYAPNGVNPPTPQGAAELDRLALEPEKYILTVARLIEPKGIHYLIESFLRLKRRGLTDGLKLVIVGDSAFTDDYVRRIKAQAAGHADIVFTGYRSGQPLEELYAHCRLFALPSETEGMPLVVLEAMSHGKAVLVSDIPEMLEVTGDAGLAHRNKDVDDLTEKLAALLGDQAAAHRLGLAARRRVAQEYSWDRSAARVHAVYGSLAGKPACACGEAKCGC